MEFYKHFFVICFLIIAGCTEESQTTPPFGTFDAIVSGTIIDQNEEAVGAANILVEFNFVDCSSDEWISAGVLQSNADGEFGRRIIHFSEDIIKCLQFSTSSPINSFPKKIIQKEVSLPLRLSEPFSRESVSIEVERN